MWTDRVILTLKGIILTNVKTLNPSCGPSGSLSLKSLESKVYDDACKVMPQQNFQMNKIVKDYFLVSLDPSCRPSIGFGVTV